MKISKPKIIIIPHYSGSQKHTEVFKRVITNQIEKKLNNSESKSNK